MIRRPPRTTPTDTPFPSTTLVRSAFWNADLDEAIAHAVAVVREVRPQVVVTYDENGGYGHPDHIQAHRVAMGAVEAAADPVYRPELGRSEEHTSELPSLMRISYAVFCLNKQNCIQTRRKYSL